MSISNILNWVRENHMTIFDWAISMAAIVVPLIISRPGKQKIVDRKNLFKAYIVFTIKIVFYQFALLCVFWGAGSVLRVPYSIGWMNKKMYLICCVIISGLCCLFAGLNWAKRLDLLKKAGKYSRICTIILLALPILLQSVTYIIALAKAVPSRQWIFAWVPLNFFVVLVTAFIVSDYDFFEYQNIILTLEDDEKFEVEPDTLYSKGKWIIVDSSSDDKTTKFQEDGIRKVECYKGDWKKSRNAMRFGKKLFYCTICLCYLLIIGVVSQLLFQAVIKPIAVTERKICLEQGENYQLNAVALDPDARELGYAISGSSEISVSENGVVTVSNELPEAETITAEVTISDDMGNTATVQVEARKQP